jgi:hypothetical protein
MMALMMSMRNCFCVGVRPGFWHVVLPLLRSGLVWQMPVAWFTFWKSEWGTWMTPADSAALEKIEKWEMKLMISADEEYTAKRIAESKGVVLFCSWQSWRPLRLSFIWLCLLSGIQTL